MSYVPKATLRRAITIQMPIPDLWDDPGRMRVCFPQIQNAQVGVRFRRNRPRATHCDFLVLDVGLMIAVPCQFGKTQIVMFVTSVTVLPIYGGLLVSRVALTAGYSCR